MLGFENIEHLVFNGIEPKTELKPAERAARGALKHLLKEFINGKLDKEKASLAKAELKKKYNECIKHEELMELIKNRILKACWDFNQSNRYAAELLEDFGAVYDMPDAKEYDLYKDIAFAACEYFDNKLAEPERWKNYRKEMDKLNYLVVSQEKGQLSIEERNNIERQRKKVMSKIMEYAFYRICRGLPKINDENVEILLDMPKLWNMVLDMAEQGKIKEINNILEGMRIIYRQLNKTM